MPNVELSPETVRRLELVFEPDHREEAARLLVEQCGSNLPFLAEYDQFQLERFRYAALKLSEGKLEKLRRAIDIGKRDWRDLLVYAGFATRLQAHNEWLPRDRAE